MAEVDFKIEGTVFAAIVRLRQEEFEEVSGEFHVGGVEGAELVEGV